MLRTRFWALCVPGLFLYSLAAADTVRQEEDDSLETLVVTSPLASWGSAGSVSSLSGEDFADASFVHPYELFARLPGIWVSHGSGQEHLTALRSPVLTGPGACGSFLILEDGIPIRPSGFCNVNSLFESTLELATGVEVARGPASAFGGTALHGAININHDSGGARDNHLALDVGPWEYGALTFGWQRQQDDKPVQLGVFTANDGGYRDDSGYALSKAHLSHSWIGTSGADYSLRANLVDLQQETAGYINGSDAYRAPEVERRRNENPEAYRDASALRLSLSRFGGTADASTALHAWGRSNDMEFLLHFLPCQPLERNNHQSFGASWQRNRSTDGGHLTWGALAEVAQVHLDQYQPQVCNLRFGPKRFPQGWHYDYDVTSSNGTLWANGHLALGAGAGNGEGELLWDIRLEQLSYSYANNLPAGAVMFDEDGCGTRTCRYYRPADRDDSFSLLGGRLALAFRPEGWQWHLALAAGNRAPQIAEIYRLQEGQTVAALEPEQLIQLEWGGSWQGQGTALEWALYSSQKNNYIFRDSDRAITTGGSIDHLGAELSLNADLSDTQRLDLALTLADYSYAFAFETFGIPRVDTEVQAGNEVDTAPGETASLRWLWQPESALSLRLEAEWLYLGAYYSDATNSYSYPGHDLLNLRLSLSPLPRLSLHLRLSNALDTVYANRADFNTNSGEERYFPGQPRALYLSARWNLKP